MNEKPNKRRGREINLNLLSEMGIGKIPPQDISLEEKVLGSVLLDPVALHRVANDIRNQQLFYAPKHQVIAKAIIDLYDDKKGVDISTVVAQLRSNGDLENAGGPFHISTLTSPISHTVNIADQVLFLKQSAIKRALITFSMGIQQRGFEDEEDALQLLGDAETGIKDIATGLIPNNDRSIKEVMDHVMTDLTKKDVDNGIPTGFKSIDNVVSGFKGGELILLAARPGMGKTTLTLQICHNIADTGKPVLFLTGEMTPKQLGERLLSTVSGISSKKLRSKNISEQEFVVLNKRSAEISAVPFHIVSFAGKSLNQIIAIIRYYVIVVGVKIVGMDYIQLAVRSTRPDEVNNEVGIISTNIKQLTTELDIPIIALSQLSREVEKRGNKVPSLSDLRQSGNLEQDADIIGFIYRPEYYDIHVDESGKSMAGVARVLWRKFRNATMADSELGFHDGIFSDGQPTTISSTPAIKLSSFFDDEDDQPF